MSVIGGYGYSLMWHPGKEFVRVDWKPGSLLVPPEGWYHHHFTTSKEPARYLALRRGLRHVGHPWRPGSKCVGAKAEVEESRQSAMRGVCRGEIPSSEGANKQGMFNEHGC